MLNEFLRKLFAELGISSDPESLSVDQAWDLVRPKLALMKDILVDKAVADGLAAGKLAPHEIDWAKEQAAKSLEVFRVFIAKREKVPAMLLARNQRRIEGDELQKSINKQMGVSDELFAKWESPSQRKIPIGAGREVTVDPENTGEVDYRTTFDPVGQKIRRAMLIPRKVWKRYYPDEAY
jgi:hypothetical protein